MQLVDRFGAVALSESVLTALVSGSLITGSLVVSESGSFTDSSGVSNGISNPTDRAWLASLRRHSEIVLTSGETYRREGYRMPKTADLAILTRSGVNTKSLTPAADQRVIVLADLPSYQDSISSLQGQGYSRIHLEFGPKGMRKLIASSLKFSLFLSGPSREALDQAASGLGARLEHLCSVENLHLGLAR